MSESEIRAYAQGRGFHDQTLARWLGWERTDRDALGELASGLKIGENHLRDMMDWLEDTASSDHAKISQILATKAISDLNTDPHEPYEVKRGDRIAQLVIQRVEECSFVSVDVLPDSARGLGGFGSTGT